MLHGWTHLTQPALPLVLSLKANEALLWHPGSRSLFCEWMEPAQQINLWLISNPFCTNLQIKNGKKDALMILLIWHVDLNESLSSSHQTFTLMIPLICQKSVLRCMIYHIYRLCRPCSHPERKGRVLLGTKQAMSHEISALGEGGTLLGVFQKLYCLMLCCSFTSADGVYCSWGSNFSRKSPWIAAKRRTLPSGSCWPP